MDPFTSTGHDALDTIVIGAGQAGLATAFHLRAHGLRFLVVDAAGEVGHTWRSRWDSLRLFTPAEYDNLPGMPFPAAPDTYPTKDQVAAYLTAYAERFNLPILLGCAVTRLEHDSHRFILHTRQGLLAARQVVVATGPFQTPAIPAVAAELRTDVRQVHSATYRNPGDLPRGPVVVVGAGNSGRQIAAELAQTHEVSLAVGTEALELPQRLAGRDLFWWLSNLGVVSRTADSSLARRMRQRGDLVIGSPMRQLRKAGVDIRPRLTSAVGNRVEFADGSTLHPSAVVWATGFRTDYSWLRVSHALSDGQPLHHRGVSRVPGLHYVGLPWQHTRGSALLGFVQHDAAWIADQVHNTHARRLESHRSLSV
jgi:putative flavoprotein involved in K+ transport